MLNPWNNTAAVNLDHKVPHSHETLVVLSVRSVWACFLQRGCSTECVRGWERTCVICEKGCPVESEPTSSAPAPHLSAYPPFSHSFCLSVPLVLFFLLLLLCIKTKCQILQKLKDTREEATKRHTLCPMSLSPANIHLRNVSARFLSFPSIFLFFSLLSQLYRCLMFCPRCRERTVHLSSSGGWR